MPAIELKNYQSSRGLVMSQELHTRLKDGGIAVPDECVSFDIVAEPGSIVAVIWRCHATNSLLAALGKDDAT